MLVQIANYLLHTLATLYLGVLLLRLLMQICRVDFYNPIAQLVVRLSHPLVGPLRRVIPPFGRLDSATAILLVAFELIAIVLLAALNGVLGLLGPLAVLWWALIGVLSLLINLYFILFIVMIVLSWVAPTSRHPAALLVWQLTEPAMAPFRKLIPPLGGLDITPIFAFILINVLKIIIHNAAVATGLAPALVPGFY